MNWSSNWARWTGGSRVASMTLVALFLCACNQSNEVSVPTPRDESLHAVMVERIDTLSRRIDILTSDQNQSPVELERARRQVSDEVAVAARELAAEVSLLDLTGDALDLSPQEQLQFRALAQELRSAGEELALAAGDADADLETALARLQQSCAVCHELYRGR